MTKFRIGANGKMEAIPEEKIADPVAEVNKSFDDLMKETTSQAVQDVKQQNEKIISQITQPPISVEERQWLEQQRQQKLAEIDAYRQQQMQQQVQQQQIQTVEVTFVLTEGIAKKVNIEINKLNNFLDTVDSAIADGTTIRLDNFIINAKQIVYYTFE